MRQLLVSVVLLNACIAPGSSLVVTDAAESNEATESLTSCSQCTTSTACNTICGLRDTCFTAGMCGVGACNTTNCALTAPASAFCSYQVGLTTKYQTCGAYRTGHTGSGACQWSCASTSSCAFQCTNGTANTSCNAYGACMLTKCSLCDDAASPNFGCPGQTCTAFLSASACGSICTTASAGTTACYAPSGNPSGYAASSCGKFGVYNTAQNCSAVCNSSSAGSTSCFSTTTFTNSTCGEFGLYNPANNCDAVCTLNSVAGQVCFDNTYFFDSSCGSYGFANSCNTVCSPAVDCATACNNGGTHYNGSTCASAAKPCSTPGTPWDSVVKPISGTACSPTTYQFDVANNTTLPGGQNINYPAGSDCIGACSPKLLLKSTNTSGGAGCNACHSSHNFGNRPEAERYSQKIYDMVMAPFVPNPVPNPPGTVVTTADSFHTPKIGAKMCPQCVNETTRATAAALANGNCPSGMLHIVYTAMPQSDVWDGGGTFLNNCNFLTTYERSVIGAWANDCNNHRTPSYLSAQIVRTSNANQPSNCNFDANGSGGDDDGSTGDEPNCMSSVDDICYSNNLGLITDKGKCEAGANFYPTSNQSPAVMDTSGDGKVALGEWMAYFNIAARMAGESLDNYRARIGAAVYYNRYELGLGREVACGVFPTGATAQTLTRAGCLVTNYGFTHNDTARALNDAINGQYKKNTVVISYQQSLETGPSGGTGGYGVQFGAFDQNGMRTNAAQLDHFGARPMPHICMGCHGGAYNGSKHLAFNARFLPVNYFGVVFSSSNARYSATNASQLAAINTINDLSLKITQHQLCNNVPQYNRILLPAQLNFLAGLYNGGAPYTLSCASPASISASAIPGHAAPYGWNGGSNQDPADLWQFVIGNQCAGCHNAFGDSDADAMKRNPMRDWATFSSTAKTGDWVSTPWQNIARYHVLTAEMPHSQHTMATFWGAGLGPDGAPGAFAPYRYSGNGTFVGTLPGNYTSASHLLGSIMRTYDTSFSATLSVSNPCTTDAQCGTPDGGRACQSGKCVDYCTSTANCPHSCTSAPCSGQRSECEPASHTCEPCGRPGQAQCVGGGPACHQGYAPATATVCLCAQNSDCSPLDGVMGSSGVQCVNGACVP